MIATTGGSTHIDDGACAESCAPIKPVIALQFVHFDAFAIVDRRRSQSHDEGMGALLSVRPGQTPPDCAGMGALVVAHETKYARDDRRVSSEVEGGGRFGLRSVRVFACGHTIEREKM